MIVASKKWGVGFVIMSKVHKDFTMQHMNHLSKLPQSAWERSMKVQLIFAEPETFWDQDDRCMT